MDLFDRLDEGGYEELVFCHDRGTGLRAAVAIHSTRLGPALGGTRFYPYGSEAAAVDDVLRLAEAMTFKAALAGLDLGGGKAVILGDPATDKTEALLRVYGRFLDSLGGRYVTAEDVGTSQADMDVIGRETASVTGRSPSLGGSGDPSPATASGVLQGMRAVALHLWGDRTLAGRHVAIAGVGKVGSDLARRLLAEGARVSAADVFGPAIDRAVREIGVEPVDVEKVHALDCDLYAPCAMGGALNRATIPQLRAAAVVGGANNQLADPACAGILAEAGVLYAPDYAVNAGGVINVAEELVGYDAERAETQIARIFDTTLGILARAETDGVTTVEAADRMARQRIDSVSAVQHIRSFR